MVAKAKVGMIARLRFWRGGAEGSPSHGERAVGLLSIEEDTPSCLRQQGWSETQAIPAEEQLGEEVKILLVRVTNEEG